MKFNKLYHEDCFDTMKRMENESIDIVITSPPYNLGKPKKSSFWNNNTSNGSEFLEYDEYDDDLCGEEYIKWQHSLFHEWMRIIKNDGVIFYNHKPRILNLMLDDRKQLIPYPIRQEIVWYKRNSMVNFNGSFFVPNTERIYIIAKKNWKPNKEFLKFGEVWDIIVEKSYGHPASFPVKLIERIILSSTKENDIVYDPFMGSGTTAVASIMHDRRWVGSEISENYINISNERIKKQTQQSKISDWI
jgi:site-specific DNA-methyltransferase (adenine-specific)